MVLSPGDLLFGHNPPDQNDSGGIQQSQRSRIHHGYQLIGQLGVSFFRDRLLAGWRAEVDSRKMSANLLADLDFEEDIFGNDDVQESSSSSKKKKKKKKKKEDASNSSRKDMERLREEERALAAEILTHRQVGTFFFPLFFFLPPFFFFFSSSFVLAFCLSFLSLGRLWCTLNVCGVVVMLLFFFIFRTPLVAKC